VWRVLVVDDSPLIRNSMQAALEPYGVEIGHAENGQVAVELALASSWDLIFLDVVMPVMDGPTALREIRARGNTTPVVLVTSVSTATVVAGAVKLGGVHYIAKPFTREQIRAVATKLLKLDPAILATPPRVLLQHADPALPGELRRLLPAHITIDVSQALAQSLDLAEELQRDLVIFDAHGLEDELTAIAHVLRGALPAAGIFAMTDDVAGRPLWCPEAALDGILPRALDAATGRGFLYQNFLRPLVRLDGMVVRAAGFLGAPAHLPAYVAMLARVLVERSARLDANTDLQIDLTRMPEIPDAVVEVITSVNRELREVGAAPSFRITPAMQAATTGRLGRLVLL
jgi:two-component system chemotaxis response regulator CheY